MILKFEGYMLSIMKLCLDGKTRKSRDFYSVADLCGITDEEKLEMLASGTQPVYQNRIAWAKSYLLKAGFLERPMKNQYVISDKGKEYMKTNPIHIDKKILEYYSPGFLGKTIKNDDLDANDEKNDIIESSVTPEEQMENAFKNMESILEKELLDKILAQDALFFERLVMRLLEKMGYGKGQLTKKSHDEGIDAIIDADQLGLEKIYIQAKRWQIGNAVSRKEVQSFAGAITGIGGQKGVFITTSDFTDEAWKFNPHNVKIIKINGDKLAKLMIKYELGVFVSHSYLVKKVDTDFFDEE